MVENAIFFLFFICSKVDQQMGGIYSLDVALRKKLGLQRPSRKDILHHSASKTNKPVNYIEKHSNS